MAGCSLVRTISSSFTQYSCRWCAPWVLFSRRVMMCSDCSTGANCGLESTVSWSALDDDAGCCPELDEGSWRCCFCIESIIHCGMSMCLSKAAMISGSEGRKASLTISLCTAIGGWHLSLASRAILSANSRVVSSGSRGGILFLR